MINWKLIPLYALPSPDPPHLSIQLELRSSSLIARIEPQRIPGVGQAAPVLTFFETSFACMAMCPLELIGYELQDDPGFWFAAESGQLTRATLGLLLRAAVAEEEAQI